MFEAPTARVDVFVVDAVGGTTALVLLEELRTIGVRADRAYGGRAFRKQMEAANKSGARFAVILGEKELVAGNVAVRDLESGDQTEVHRDLAAPWLKTRLEG